MTSMKADSMPPESDHHRMGLHLPGILRLLSDHLYADPKVVLRELLQNAYDSCLRRLYEAPNAGRYVPRIEVEIDVSARRVRITDNGMGLTEVEIHRYVSTIGRG